MRSHCREFTRRTGLPCDIDVHEDFDDLDPSWSIAFYRIVQEALTNITKHAQANHVRITLAREPEGVRLRIADDGVGPDRRGAGQAQVARRGGHARADARDGRDVRDPPPGERPGHRRRGLHSESGQSPHGARRRKPALRVAFQAARSSRREMNRAMSGTFRHRQAVVSAEGRVRPAYRGDAMENPMTDTVPARDARAYLGHDTDARAELRDGARAGTDGPAGAGRHQPGRRRALDDHSRRCRNVAETRRAPQRYWGSA